MTDRERAANLFDAAQAAHQLERNLLSLVENIRRGETPDGLALGSIAVDRARIDVLIRLALPVAA